MVKTDKDNHDDELATDTDNTSDKHAKTNKKPRKSSKKVPERDKTKKEDNHTNKSVNSAQAKDERLEKIVEWIGGLIGIALFGGIIFVFIQIKNGIESSLYTPSLSLDGIGINEPYDGHFDLDNVDDDTEINIFTGNGYDTNKKTTVTVDGVEAELCAENQGWTCDFKISYNKLDNSKMDHEIVATNQWGEDKATFYVKHKENDTNSNSSWSSKPSTEDTKKTVAHLVCQNYIKKYFYPSAVKIHSILGVGMDRAYGESWQYGVDVTVTSAAGGEIMYKAICTVGEWQNLSAGAYDGASGSVIAFKVEPY